MAQRFLIVVALGLAGLSAFSASGGNEEEVRAYVNAFAESWNQATGPQDIAAFYATDATHIGPEGEWVRDRDALAGDFLPLAAAELDIEQIRFIAASVALVDGSIVVPGKLPTRLALVLKRRDGRWTIAASRVLLPG